MILFFGSYKRDARVIAYGGLNVRVSKMLRKEKKVKVQNSYVVEKKVIPYIMFIPFMYYKQYTLVTGNKEEYFSRYKIKSIIANTPQSDELNSYLQGEKILRCYETIEKLVSDKEITLENFSDIYNVIKGNIILDEFDEMEVAYCYQKFASIFLKEKQIPSIYNSLVNLSEINFKELSNKAKNI